MKTVIYFIISVFIVCGILNICYAEETENIDGILAKSDNIENIQYEVIATVTSSSGSLIQDDLVVPVRVWEKPPYMRQESIMLEEPVLLEIKHPDVTYRYNFLEDIYIQQEVSIFTQHNLLTEILKEIKENTTLKIIGTELVGGEETTIIEYSYDKGLMPYTAKAWIRNKDGIPLKIEKDSKTGKLYGKEIIEIKNIVFDEIPDSLFEIPQDKIKKMPIEDEKDLIESAKMDINSIILVALDMYDLDNDSYPSTEQGLAALIAKPTIDPIPENWNGPYLSKVPKDPWGNDYLYYNPSRTDEMYKFDLYSLGPDGIRNTEDDIVYRRPDRRKKKKMDSEGLIARSVGEELPAEILNKIENMQLVGIIGKQAIIKILGERKTYYANEGELVGSFKVKKVSKDNVILLKDGKEYILTLE